jgi:cytochrome c oxidase subunit 4
MNNATSARAHAHILPLKVYFGVFAALIAGTALTVAAATVHLGPLNVPIMLAIAVVKASLVALIFMHLLYDEKFNLLVLLFGLVFVTIFFAFTLADTTTRGSVDPREGRFIAAEMDRPVYGNEATAAPEHEPPAAHNDQVETPETHETP